MKEKRTTEIRTAEGKGGEMVLKGKPIVYGVPATIQSIGGSFTEIIERGALNGVNLNDTHLFYNHDTNKVPLARAPRTMQLEETRDGLEIMATLPDTQEARSVYTAVERGDLTGMSFAFTCDKSGSEYDARSNTRRITKFNKILECSIVPFPAYDAASVEARNQIDEAIKRENTRKSLLIRANNILFRG